MTARKTKTSRGRGKPLLSILVPVYNEETTIKNILDRVTTLPIERYEVLVVDDASNDKSRSIIDAFAKKFSKSNVELKILSHPKNRGKGAGIKTALGLAEGEYFIIQDADLEYDPKDIPPLLEAARKGKYRAVYGSRFKGRIKSMPKPNYFANKFYNFLLRRMYKTSITDMHTCYKMVDVGLLRDLKMESEGFDYATELISKLLRRGVDIHEAPIGFNGRTKKEGKKIGIKDGIDCTYMIFKYRLSKKI